MAVEIDPDKCTCCGSCFEVCPVDAIVMVNKKVEIDVETCVECGTCVGECSAEAISLDE